MCSEQTLAWYPYDSWRLPRLSPVRAVLRFGSCFADVTGSKKMEDGRLVPFTRFAFPVKKRFPQKERGRESQLRG